MQACRAYYRNGQFVPVETLEIPEGSEAIVTVIDFPRDSVSRRQIEAMQRFREGIKNCDEPVPEFERIKLREIEI